MPGVERRTPFHQRSLLVSRVMRSASPFAHRSLHIEGRQSRVSIEATDSSIANAHRNPAAHLRAPNVYSQGYSGLNFTSVTSGVTSSKVAVTGMSTVASSAGQSTTLETRRGPSSS